MGEVHNKLHNGHIPISGVERETDFRPREGARPVKAISPSLYKSTAAFIWTKQS